MGVCSRSYWAEASYSVRNCLCVSISVPLWLNLFFLQIGPTSDYFWSFLYSQVCIQYFVWTEYALLDGTSYAISSWFFKWFAWPNEGTMTELFKWRQGGIRKHLNVIAISNMSTDLFTGVRCWSLSTRASGHWIVTCKLQNYTNTVFTISLAQKFTSWHLLSIWLIRLAHHGQWVLLLDQLLVDILPRCQLNLYYGLGVLHHLFMHTCHYVTFPQFGSQQKNIQCCFLPIHSLEGTYI